MLIRALEPLEGIELMRAAPRVVQRLEDLCSGPGKLTQALGVELELNGDDLAAGPDRDPRAATRRAGDVELVAGHAHRDHQGRRAAVALLRGGQPLVSRPWPPGAARVGSAARRR